MNSAFQAAVARLALPMSSHAKTVASFNAFMLQLPPRRAKSGLSYQVASERAKALEEPKPQGAPLSVLPASALLRSLLVATVSSKPYLLRPTITFLSWLTRSNGGFLWNVDRNPILRGSLKNTFYKHFCAGESTAEARENIQRMRSLGYRGAMLQNAKETVFDYKSKMAHGQGIASAANGDPARCKSIASWGKETLDTAAVLQDGDLLALKLTGAGPLVTEALADVRLPPKPLMDVMHEVCVRCRDKGVRVLIDAESQHYQEGIFLVGMELSRQYNRDGYAVVYNTYQAYLKSTPGTLSRHLEAAAQEGFALGLKLVRGAYMGTDERSLIHDTKKETDDAYNNIARELIQCQFGRLGAQGGLPFPSVELLLASHNRESLVAAHKMHCDRTSRGLPTVRLDFAQLQGMADTLSLDLIQMRRKSGASVPNVYKCSTWGTLRECLAYLMRRATENRDAVSRTADEYLALKREVKRRLGFSSST